MQSTAPVRTTKLTMKTELDRLPWYGQPNLQWRRN